MSSLQQNWRRRQNRFFLQRMGMGGERERVMRGRGKGERNGPNNVCIYEKIKINFKRNEYRIFKPIEITIRRHLG
jgi:hypothetical protein